MTDETTNEWEIEDTGDRNDDELRPHLEYEILNYPADTTLEGYRQQQNDGILELPKFQRKFVWNQVKASKLIESFLIGLPVPGVFLYKPRDSSTLQVIDGHQRITSVVSFLNGTIGEKKFRLKGVADAWLDKTFEELDEKDQFKLKQAVMRSTIIQQLDPMDDTSIYLIFERLNTGGMNLNPMEVRRCVSHGSFIDFVDRLNKYPAWRKCINKPKIDQRFRDVELLLKVLAFCESRENYDKPAKVFLNKYTADNRNRKNLDDLEERFNNACDSVMNVFDEKPFHLRGRLNQAAVDSILSTIMTLNSRPNSDSFKNLFEDEEFVQGTTRNTSDNLEVGLRLQAAARHLG